MATFNGFPKLPGEIRNMIWSFAIRDDRPGVHIFRSKKCAGASRFEKAWIGSGPKLDPFPSFPSVKEDDPIRKNESMYLIDAGLWMACKESRAIIGNRFGIPKWTIRQCQDQSIDGAGDYLVSLEDCGWLSKALPPRVRPVEKSTALPDGKSLELSKPDYFWGSPLPQFTTSQQRDLFVLQAWSLRDVDWNHLTFDFGFGPCTLRSRYGLNNIGVVYNPSWWHKENEDWRPHVIKILAEYSSKRRFNPVDRLWIVDHGLKRSEDAPTIEEMSAKSEVPYRTFYTSDRKLVEVNDWNMEHFTLYYPEALDKEGQPLLDSSVDLAWRLYGTYGRPVSVLGWDDLDS